MNGLRSNISLINMQTLSIVLIKDPSDSYTIQKLNVQTYVIVLNVNARIEKTIREIEEMLNRKFDIINLSFHGMDHNPSLMGMFDRFRKNDKDDDSSEEIIFEQPHQTEPQESQKQELEKKSKQPEIQKLFANGRHNRMTIIPVETYKRLQGPQGPQRPPESAQSSSSTAAIRAPHTKNVKEDAMKVIGSMTENGAYPDFMSKKAKTIQSCLNFIMTVLDKRHEIVYAEQVRLEMLKYL